MEHVDVDAQEPTSLPAGADLVPLADALGATDVALNRFRVPPGERISGLHGHGDQEEVFVAVEGTVTVETLDGDVTVASPGAVRFGPGEYQSVTNDNEEAAVVYAIGAPPDSEDVRIPLACPSCGHDYLHPELADDGETPVLACPDCGAETVATCPECGSESVHAEVGEDGEPVSVCRDCGTRSRP